MCVDPIIIGRSGDGFEQAAQEAVRKWEEQRGGEPAEPTTLQVDLYVDVHGAIHDYIAALKTSG